jgi:expansin (peptidoglycan-binding protein)
MYTALSTDLYDSPTGSGACGKCVEITGASGKPQTLLVVDQCPAASNAQWCSTYHLDLSPTAYQAVQGSMSPGSVANGTYTAKFVPCSVTGNIIYDVTSLQAYYLAMVITNARYGIKSVSYRASGSGAAWTAMEGPSDADAHWVINGVAPPSTADFEITDEWGQVEIDTDVKLTAGNVTGAVQFPACS